MSEHGKDLVPSAVVVVTKDAKVRAGEGMLPLGGARKRATGSDNASPLMRDFAAGMTDLRLSSCDHDPSVAGQQTGDLSLLAHASMTAPWRPPQGPTLRARVVARFLVPALPG